MDQREQKIVLEGFLKFHGIELLPWSRLALFGRRFGQFFPEIAVVVNPDRKPWTVGFVEKLASFVAGLDPASFTKNDQAREPHVAKKYRKIAKTNAFLNSWEWRALRYEVLRDRGAKCELCGATSKDQRIEVDHIKPISKFWQLRLTKTNLQVLCRDCNQGKSNRHFDDFSCREAV